MAKALVIGGTGTLGSAVTARLKQHGLDVVTAGRASGDVQVDMTDTASISALFEQVKDLDHVVIAAGSTHYDAVPDLTPENNLKSVNNKLLGQVNTVLLGQHKLNDNGSFTLVSGILKEHPIARGASSSMVNGAIDAFVGAAAFELPRGIRLNSVSAGLLSESAEKYADYFKGFNPVPAERVANYFVRSVLGIETGKVYKIYE
ncbi:short chain dehydrogenase [Saccharibacillus sp. CPCC 101409]|uniref:short chain dehydrogenase n=1 Tax=Saccharibacillus sp. CPCC 101409 TaxID=3058041 RepID=UPI00267381D7|nr:short chain dehydrogenase [Saccharibacillus sp. CPCC 101409]MDO3410863.1 short chain dehydrogenase [Saccharibacillus sp. CPCC 101409]